MLLFCELFGLRFRQRDVVIGEQRTFFKMNGFDRQHTFDLSLEVLQLGFDHSSLGLQDQIDRSVLFTPNVLNRFELFVGSIQAILICGANSISSGQLTHCVAEPKSDLTLLLAKNRDLS